MVKRLTLIFLLLAGGANAAITVSSAQNWSAIGATSTDSVIVASGGTLTLDADYTASLAARIVIVQTGGVFNQSGYKILISALQLNGGKHIVTTNGGVYLRKDALYTYDYYIGANSTDSLDSRGTLLVHSDQPQTYGMARLYCDNTSAKVYWYRASFAAMYRSAFSGGIQFSASGRAGSLTYINRCSFDSANVSFLNVRGHKIDSSTFLLWNGQAQAVMIQGGSRDTVSNSTIYCNSQLGGALRGVYVYNSDTCVVSGSRIEAQNEGAYSSSSQAVGIDGTTSYTRIIGNTIVGFSQPITGGPSVDAGGNCVANIKTFISGNRFETGANTHEAIILYCADTGWVVQGNVFWGRATRSMINPYASKSPAPDGLQILYNTVVASRSGQSATAPVAFEHTASGNLTYNRIKMVGNALVGTNASFNGAEILFGTTSAQTVTVNFTEFKNNAFDSCYYYGLSSATYPYSRLDSNKHDQTSFVFIDSSGGDFRLDASSPLINCGDTLYGDSAFGTAQHSKIPYDIGYYQTYTTGTCGSSSPTPTGACCIAYTCYPGYTSAQCTSQGGTYQGDGTTTCTSCTAPGGNVGTGYGKRSWATFATLNYGDASYNLPSLAPTVAHYMDISVNLSGAMKTAVQALDPNIGVVPYHLSATLYPEDTAEWRTYATANGYNFDSGFIWADGATACINPINPTANGICVGNTICTPSGQKMTICAWNTIRLIPNFRYQGMLNFIKSKFHSDASGTGNRGLMNDEATFQWQDTLTHHQTNSAWFPFPGYWSSGSAANTNAWTGSGLTNTQIADSLIRMRRTGWYKEVIDSFKVLGKQVYMNGAAYGQMTSDIAGDMATLGSGALWGETENIALGTANGYYSGLAWTMMDSLRIGGRKWQEAQAIVWTNINATDTATLTPIDGALGMKRRLAQERYCWYMMAQTPLRSFLFISLNWGGLGHQNGWSIASDSLFKVCPSMDAPLGAPSGGRTVLSSGTGGTVYQRSFANGKVLWRDGSGGSYTSANAITVALGATYYPVNYDGTYGTPTSTASIRNGEGLVFITSTSSATGTLSIDNPTTPEGSNMVFTVTLSPAQTVPVSVNYITSPGSGAAITDYTDQSGTISFGIGQTTATISIPTVDRAGCLPSRTFNVTLYGANPGTSITIPSPTATGTITDGDCGTPYNRTYKGKIVIKGKVKP